MMIIKGKKRFYFVVFLSTVIFFAGSLLGISYAQEVDVDEEEIVDTFGQLRNKDLSNLYGQLAYNYEDLPLKDGIKIGELVFHSAFSVGERVERNIYLEDKDVNSDWITIYKPSVGVQIPLKDNSINIDHEIAINCHDKYEGEDHTDHSTRALAEINLTDYTITLFDKYRRYTDRASSEISDRIKQQTNDFRAGVAAEFDQLGFDIGYNNTIKDYLTNNVSYSALGLTYDGEDHMTHMVDAKVLYKIMPKTWIFVENDLGFIKYDKSTNPDSYFEEMLLGIRGKPTNKLTTNVKGGFRWQRYDDQGIIQKKDYTGFVTRGRVDFNMTDDDIFNLVLEKSIYESTYQDVNYYNLAMSGINYTHYLNDRITISLFASFQQNLYPVETVEDGYRRKRRDDYMGGGIVIKEYVNTWFTVQADYQHLERDSNFSQYDYIDDVVTVSGIIGF